MRAYLFKPNNVDRWRVCPFINTEEGVDAIRLFSRKHKLMKVVEHGAYADNEDLCNYDWDSKRELLSELNKKYCVYIKKQSIRNPNHFVIKLKRKWK